MPARFSEGQFVGAIAEAFLAGAWDQDAMVARAAGVLGLGGRPRWLTGVVQRTLAWFGDAPPIPRVSELRRFLVEDRRLRTALARHLASGAVDSSHIDVLRLRPPPMLPATRLAGRLTIPALATAGQLAGWLGVAIDELDWFADLRGLIGRHSAEPLRHYRCVLAEKRGGRVRILECPKPRMKAMQRQILSGILDAIPLHDAAHAFRKERSILTSAAPHCGRDVLLTMDLREFFPSIHAGRVHAMFRTVGYPERVARLLTALCTTRTPADVLDDPRVDHLSRLFHRSPHLPQGAPTSPALANLCAWRLDCRLTGLAQKFGAAYTRYADDLAFSGDARPLRGIPRLRIAVCAIVLDEGFAIHRRKTRVVSRGHRQSIGGLVVNRGANVPREEYDALRAILHNCVRHGPESQNRASHPAFREHLRGRITWIASTHAERGQRLLKMFDAIDWAAPLLRQDD